VFPHDESLAGRRSRECALYDSLKERGCVFQARHGYERPGWFAQGADGGGAQEPLPYDYYGAYDNEGAWRLGQKGDFENGNGVPYSDVASIPPNGKDKFLELVEKELTWFQPKNMEEVRAECHATRNGVGIFDMSYFGKFILRGPEAFEAAQYICGADLAKQVPGSINYTPLCNERGGVEADLTVARLPDDSGYYFSAGGNTMTKDYEWITSIIEKKGFNAQLEDHSNDVAILSVQGPHSRSLLAPLINSGHTLSHEDLPFSTCADIEIGGYKLRVLRLTFVGELGFELHIPMTSAAAVYKIVREAGDEYSVTHKIPVRDAGYRAIDTLSAEKNLRHWHADLTNRDSPLEAGIGFTVLSKLKQEGGPDFLGRKALEAQRAAGLQRKLVCVTVDNPEVILHGSETMWRDDVCVGLVRSTAYGYTIGHAIAYAYAKVAPGETKVTNKWLEAGKWEIGDKGKRHAATLSLQAPFDPKNMRVKGQY
jgi:sarcosine dehydrogenase